MDLPLPALFVGTLVAITVLAWVTYRSLRHRRKTALRKIASERGMQYSQRDLFALANLNFRMSFHESGLNFQLFGPPKVIGIEKGDIAAARSAHAEIARSSHAFSGFSEES